MRRGWWWTTRRGGPGRSVARSGSGAPGAAPSQAPPAPPPRGCVGPPLASPSPAPPPAARGAGSAPGAGEGDAGGAPAGGPTPPLAQDPAPQTPPRARPAGVLLPPPARPRRARVVLRLVERDPFTGIGPPPVRGLVSITERAIIGARIDGSPLAVPLLGVHGVVIGTSGAGKSTTLRTLADAATACTDALVWDLDRAGSGLDALGPAVGRREREPAGITDALADALALAEARPRMLAELGMGAAWIPSPTRLRGHRRDPGTPYQRHLPPRRIGRARAGGTSSRCRDTPHRPRLLGSRPRHPPRPRRWTGHRARPGRSPGLGRRPGRHRRAYRVRLGAAAVAPGPA